VDKMQARRKFAGRTAGQSENSIVKGSVPDAVLKAARKSGQLNLSNRELKTVPDKVWKINQEIPEEERKASLDSDEKWWDQTELNKLILASNQITSISSDIQLLQGLVVLDVSLFVQRENLLASLDIWIPSACSCKVADCPALPSSQFQ
jgi:hypothetical protein